MRRVQPGQRQTQYAGRRKLGSLASRDNLQQASGVDTRLLVKLDVEHPRPAVDRLNARPLHHCFQNREAEQIEHGVGRWSIPVLKLVGDTLRILIRLRLGDAFVCPKPLLLIGDVVQRNADIESEVQGRMDLWQHFLAFDLLHRFLEESQIRIESYDSDVTVLLAAKKVA